LQLNPRFLFKKPPSSSSFSHTVELNQCTNAEAVLCPTSVK
jgi:hypothetical protein